jgi:DNA-(apurinic or apyrimidinic site) lyase
MENGELNVVDIYDFFEDLLRNGKNNRRFVDMKLKRIRKILDGFQNRIGVDKFEEYYKNTKCQNGMDKLAEDLAKIMNQKKDAKTIVFAVKMFSY